MRHIAIALVFLVGLASAQSKPKAPNPSTAEIESPGAYADRAGTGRYHIIAVKAPGRSVSDSIEAYDQLFLYATATGRVRRYEPSENLGEKGDPDRISTDPYFSEVTIENLNGSHEADVKRSLDLYNYLHQARVRTYCKDHPNGTYGTGTDCQSFLKAHPIQ